jgi:hypothetical protein
VPDALCPACFRSAYRGALPPLSPGHSAPGRSPADADHCRAGRSARRGSSSWPMRSISSRCVAPVPAASWLPAPGRATASAGGWADGERGRLSTAYF